MSPECQNCGATVSVRYARVFARDEDAGPRVCPDCPDMIRGLDGEPREVRSPRRAVSGSDTT